MNSMEKSMLLDELFALRKADKEEEQASRKAGPDNRTADESERKLTNANEAKRRAETDDSRFTETE